MMTALRFGLLFVALILSVPAGVAAQTQTVITAEDAARSALNVGAKAPAFQLKDSTGTDVASSELLKTGNMVLVFYRGAWCPFCNTYLQRLQARLQDIEAAGGKLVAVSVENPDRSAGIVDKNSLKFTVLSDPDLAVARRFGIVYQLPEATDDSYRSRGLDVAKYNSMRKPELPLAATYIIGRDGVIVYAFVETDYKKRAAPDVIIEHLRKLR